MKLTAMVTDSQFEDLLEELNGDELRSVCRITNFEGGQMPLVTASVTTDRLIEFARLANATPSNTQYEFPETSDALFIDGVTQAGDYDNDNMVGMIGIWRRVGEDRL